jgi:hypothetical protein
MIIEIDQETVREPTIGGDMAGQCSDETPPQGRQGWRDPIPKDRIMR